MEGDDQHGDNANNEQDGQREDEFINPGQRGEVQMVRAGENEEAASCPAPPPNTPLPPTQAVPDPREQDEQLQLQRTQSAPVLGNDTINQNRNQTANEV